MPFVQRERLLPQWKFIATGFGPVSTWRPAVWWYEKWESSKCHRDSAGHPRSYRNCMSGNPDRGVL